jgi:predicted transcriptional regulator
MAEGDSSEKVSPNLVAEIVSSYVAKNSVRPEETASVAVTVDMAPYSPMSTTTINYASELVAWQLQRNGTRSVA